MFQLLKTNNQISHATKTIKAPNTANTTLNTQAITKMTAKISPNIFLIISLFLLNHLITYSVSFWYTWLNSTMRLGILIGLIEHFNFLS